MVTDIELSYIWKIHKGSWIREGIFELLVKFVFCLTDNDF